MKTDSCGAIQSECLRLMDEVRTTREPVLITKKGRPVAKLVPAESQPEDIFGCLKERNKDRRRY